MAQSIILKRSSLPGKVPDTGSLNIGEIAINTYDGKLFIKRSGNLDSIQGILVTNSTTTGSISLTQTGSFSELVVTQDANISRDLYVTNDIIGAGDIDISGNITGSSALLSGSLILTGSQTITNDLTVLGTVNARQFNISVISSSVLFESGSSRFGNTSDDTHDFTGSVTVTGSLYLNGIDLSQGNNSGSFSGSFQGDGSGLRGVVSDDIPRDGWDYNVNSSASISDFNAESDKYHIDFAQSQSTEVGTPVGYKGFLTNVSGSTQILPTLDGIDFVVGNNVVASIGVGGIISTVAAGTVSGSSQLTSSYDTRYLVSGSVTSSINALNTATSSYETKGRGIISGSSQITPLLPTGTVSSSLQILGGTGIISSSAQLENATITNLTITNLTTVNQTASVIFSSGSNRFGDFSDDTHSFTGSVKISGSLTTIGSSTATSFSGAIAATNGVVSGSSQITYANISSIPGGIVSGSSQVVGILSSLNTYTGSNDTTNTTQNSRLTTIESATGSYETKGRSIVSGSSQIDVMSTTNIAKLATTGSNTFTGNQTITGTINTISIPNDLFAFQFLLMGG